MRYLYTSLYMGESCYWPIRCSIHGRIMSGTYTRLDTWEDQWIMLRTYTNFCTRENHIRYIYTSLYMGGSRCGPVYSSVHPRIMSGAYRRLYTWENHVMDVHTVHVHGRIMSGAYTRLYTWENHVMDLYTVLYTGESCQVPMHVSIHGRIMLWTYT